MRPGDDRHQFGDVGYFSFWIRGLQALPKASRSHDCGRHSHQEDGSHGQAHLRADARTQMGDCLWGLCLFRGDLQNIQCGAGCGSDSPSGYLCSGLPPAAGVPPHRPHEAPEEDRKGVPRQSKRCAAPLGMEVTIRRKAWLIFTWA